MTGSIWADVSDEAKEFVKALLVKDPKKRLTAKEALQHPWLQGKKAQRSEGKQLATRVVQRLQRYAAGNAFKKTALELMTNELIQRHEERMTAAETGLAQGQAQSLAQKVSKSASPVSSQDTLSQALEGSQSGRGRARGEKRLIAQDLLMSKSVHGGSLFRFTPVKPPHPLPPPLALPVISPADQSLLASSPDMRTLAEKVAAVSSPPNIASPHSSVHLSCPGRNDSTSNLQSYSLLLGAAQNLTQEVKNGLGGKIKSRERVSSMLSLLDFVDSKKSEHGKVRRLMLDTSARGGTAALSSLMEEGSNGTPRSPLAQTSVTLPANQRPGLGPSTPQRMLESLEFLLPETTVAELKSLLSQGASSDTLSFEQISEALSSLGYNLGPGEVEVLLREVSGSNETTECQSRAVSRNQFIASQVDWRDLQINHRDEWLASLRRTFEEMDTDKDGVLDKDELTSMLANRLPSEAAVNDAVNELLLDVACSDGVDFNDFVRMMREDSRSSMGSLDLYDARHEGGPPHNRYVNNAGGHLEAIESDDEEFEDDS